MNCGRAFLSKKVSMTEGALAELFVEKMLKLLCYSPNFKELWLPHNLVILGEVKNDNSNRMLSIGV